MLRRFVIILAILLTSGISAADECKNSCEIEKVEMISTPIGELELAAVLRDGHYAVFGKFPSHQRLAVAWAQVALENGRGKKTLNYNLGKITSTKNRAYYSRGYRYRAYKNFNEGAADYWRVVHKLCRRSLPSFDRGDPYGAAQVLGSCGYFEANKHRYGKSMLWLYNYANKKILPAL